MPLLRCRGRRRGVQGCCRGVKAAVAVLNLCKVPWRLILFPFNNPVVSSAGIIGFVESEVLAS
jgi:hypothetical protein